jgi:hypothetical protein
MTRILKSALRSTPTVVVIIKGNPAKMVGMEDLADAYYDEIADYVQRLGFTPTFDPGEDMTCPDKSAAFWIAHSRGAGRIRCIDPKAQWRFLKFGDLDGVIHPVDAKWQASIADHRGSNEMPPKEHFEFTREQQSAIDKLVSNL